MTAPTNAEPLEGPQADELLEALRSADEATVQRAAAILDRALREPGRLAEENAALRLARQGAYGIIHALVEQSGGGPITITAAEYRAIPPNRRLNLTTDEDGTVHVEVRTVSRVERRSESKGRGRTR